MPQPALADSLSVTASGVIANACSINVASPFAPFSLDQAGSTSASATVNCNSGFSIRATSTGGALRAARAAPTGFDNALPYSLTVSIPLDNAVVVTGSCSAARLIAGQATCALSPAGAGLSSGGISAINRTAQLQVVWQAPAQSLVAGAYTDTITLSIAVQP